MSFCLLAYLFILLYIVVVIVVVVVVVVVVIMTVQYLDFFAGFLVSDGGAGEEK